MAKIMAIIEVYENEIKAKSGQEELSDAITQELGWLHDSGMAVETWDYIDRPSRLPPWANLGKEVRGE